MNKRKQKNIVSVRRAKRTRAKILGTTERPRLSIFRSNKYVYAQLIDDLSGKTLLSASTRVAENKKKIQTEKAEILGEKIAKKAAEKGINKAVFDRGKYKYHGKVKTVAESAKRGGLLI